MLCVFMSHSFPTRFLRSLHVKICFVCMPCVLFLLCFLFVSRSFPVRFLPAYMCRFASYAYLAYSFPVRFLFVSREACMSRSASYAYLACYFPFVSRSFPASLHVMPCELISRVFPVRFPFVCQLTCEDLLHMHTCVFISPFVSRQLASEVLLHMHALLVHFPFVSLSFPVRFLSAWTPYALEWAIVGWSGDAGAGAWGAPWERGRSSTSRVAGKQRWGGP